MAKTNKNALFLIVVAVAAIAALLVLGLQGTDMTLTGDLAGQAMKSAEYQTAYEAGIDETLPYTDTVGPKATWISRQGVDRAKAVGGMNCQELCKSARNYEACIRGCGGGYMLETEMKAIRTGGTVGEGSGDDCRAECVMMCSGANGRLVCPCSNKHCVWYQ